MTGGDRRLRRVLRLQQRLEQVEVARLARTNALMRDLTEHEAQLIGYLAQGDGAAGMFPGLVLQRLADTNSRRALAATTSSAQEKAANEQARRVKQTEAMVERAERDREREEAAKELREIIDLAIGR